MQELQRLSELLPAQDVPEFLRFPPTANGARQWLEDLPRANLGTTSRALYEALTELNRTPLLPRQRLTVLDSLQPLSDSIRSGLARHYLNQPLVLPEQAARVANLVQTLNRELAQNYSRIAVDAASARDGSSRALAAIGCGRAIEALNANLLLACQLYRNPPPRTWLTLHRLYQLLRACSLEQQSVKVNDGVLKPGAAYHQALLLGSARPNQLRQRDLETAFQAMADLTNKVSLKPARDGDLWRINPNDDEGPIIAEYATGSGWLSLETSHVAAALQTEPPAGLPENLLAHLGQTWSHHNVRSFMRMESKEQLFIALGLTATHHFVADEEDFQHFISGQVDSWSSVQDNPFLRGKTVPKAAPSKKKDVWDSVYSSNYGQVSVSIETIDYHIRQHNKNQTSGQERYRYHQVDTINTSPGGYCLQWPPDARVTLRAGELVGLRQGHQNWSIATVRWVTLLPEGPRVGVQLLSPTAFPYAGRPLASTGSQGDYQRVLVLPEIKAIGQPTTLITPHLPFREGQKVELMQHGSQTRVQLTTQLASTGVYGQFEFRRLSGAGSALSSSQSESGFDALWDQL